MTIREILHAWQVWRVTQRLYRAMPELREADRQIAEARRRHQSTRLLLAQKRRIMVARLMVEVRHG